MDLLSKAGVALKFIVDERKQFVFNGGVHKYFYHPYQVTFINERMVEIPIVKRFLEQYKGRRILEIGNVMSHYFDVKKEFGKDYIVVDKYEDAANTLKVDIMDFDNNGIKFDLIVSVSTFEHVGDDDAVKDPSKAVKAVEHVKTLLKKGGVFVCTIPPGFNKELTSKAPKLFNKVYCMKKEDNEWIECDYHDIKDVTFTVPTSGVIVGIARK